jgi:hypothetical protein
MGGGVLPSVFKKVWRRNVTLSAGGYGEGEAEGRYQAV